jgi:hypothetical protein
MQIHAILLNTTPDDLLACLHSCTHIAHKELALHPLRPRPMAMLPHYVPLHHLFHFVREVADWCVGIYEALPETKPPFGTPLLLLGSLRVEVADASHVPIGIWRHPMFPLDLIEVAWELENSFPSVQAPDSPLNGFLRPCDLPSVRPARPFIHRSHSMISPSAQVSALSSFVSSSERLPTATPGSWNGAPGASLPPRGLPANMLASTQWLVEQIAGQPNPADPEPFYQEWMEMHKFHTGFYPRDSDRSFNKALDSAFRHLGRTRRRQRKATE